jgi:hypothetical protein
VAQCFCYSNTETVSGLYKLLLHLTNLYCSYLFLGHRCQHSQSLPRLPNSHFCSIISFPSIPSTTPDYLASHVYICGSAIHLISQCLVDRSWSATIALYNDTESQCMLVLIAVILLYVQLEDMGFFSAASCLTVSRAK